MTDKEFELALELFSKVTDNIFDLAAFRGVDLFIMEMHKNLPLTPNTPR